MGFIAAIAFTRAVVKLIRAAGQKAVPLPGDLRDVAFRGRFTDEELCPLDGLDGWSTMRETAVSRIAPRAFRGGLHRYDEENFYPLLYNIEVATPYLWPGSAIIATLSEQAYNPSPTSTIMHSPRRSLIGPHFTVGYGW